ARVNEQLGRLGPGAGGTLLRFLPRARRDLLAGLARRPQQTLDLVPGLIERVPHRRRRRRTHLQLRDRPIDPLDVPVDSTTLLAANETRNENTEQPRRHVLTKPTEPLPLPLTPRRPLPALPPPAPLRRVIRHKPEYDQSSYRGRRTTRCRCA